MKCPDCNTKMDQEKGRFVCPSCGKRKSPPKKRK